MSLYKKGLKTATKKTSSKQSYIVGLSLFHTVGDRDRAVQELNTGWNQFRNEAYAKMGVDPSKLDPKMMTTPQGLQDFQAELAKLDSSPYGPTWVNLISPVMAEWQNFYADQSTWNEFLTSFEQYERWYDRLAESRKIWETETKTSLSTKAPNQPSPTVFSEAVTAAKQGIGEVFGSVKLLIYGALGVGGLWGVSQVVKSSSKKK